MSRRRLGRPAAGRPVAGKVVVVTGGARGVGRATGHALVQAGARVALFDTDAGLVESVAVEVGNGAIGLSVDVTDHAAYSDRLDEVERRLGPIDVLVNNAGIMPIGPFEDEPDTLAQRVIDVNFGAVLWSTKESVRRWRAARRTGHVINVASGAGWIAAGGGATYSGSKFAVVGFSHAASLELRGTGIDISVVAPAIIQTELATGLGELKGVKMISPDDVAVAIVDGIRRPRFAIWVPKAMGVMALTLSAIPYGIRDALARRLDVDKLLLSADRAARAEYESRVAGSDRRANQP